MVLTGLHKQDKEWYRQGYMSKTEWYRQGIHDLDKEWYRQGIHALVSYCRKAVEVDGDFVENQGLETNLLT
jgi:hypothetical protein